MVGTEHRDHADFAMVRLFRGLSWTQQQCTVIQRITVSNISVTAVNLFAPTLTLTGLKNGHGLWFADSSRQAPGSVYSRLRLGEVRRRCGFSELAFCTRGYLGDLRALMSATHKAALLSLARVEEVARDVAPCVDTGGDRP